MCVCVCVCVCACVRACVRVCVIFSGHSQQVVFVEAASSACKITSGVPGQRPWPCLILIYINDITINIRICIMKSDCLQMISYRIDQSRLQTITG